MKRVHIVGCPRSGTTLLMELMSTCFESDGFCEHEMSIFTPLELASDAKVYFTKQPNDIRALQHIFTRDKNLFVIYSGRDPRAVITSHHRENPNEFFCNYRIWRECDRAAQRYEGHPRFFSMRYEDLLMDADSIQQKLCAQFPFLQQRHTFSEYSKFAKPSKAASRAMNGLRKIDSSSLNKWYQFLPRIAQQYALYPTMTRDLIRLAYEKDTAWTAILNGVAGEELPCRYTDKKPVLKEWEKALRIYIKSRAYLAKLSPGN